MDVNIIKDEYTRKMHSKLDQWSAEIDELSAKVDQSKAHARVEYHKQVEVLQSKKDEARQRLIDLERAGDSAWEDLKSGVEVAWDSLGEAVDSAKSRFK